MPHKCPICDQQFPYISGLQCHECKPSGENCRGGGRSPEKAKRIKDLDENTMIDVLPSAGCNDSESKCPEDASTTRSQSKSPEISNKSTNVSGTMATKKQTPLSYNEENECMICGKTFQYLFILDSHLRAHSAEEIDKILKMFQSSTNDEGLNLLASWEPYTCKECGYECCTSVELKTHMLSHSAEEHPNTSSSATELETHSQVHSNMLRFPAYTCKFCVRTFKKKYNWQIHMKTHTGERDYFCHFCARTFWRKYNWKIHMKMHTGERAYFCNYCPKSFITSSRLKFHVKSKHSNETLDVGSTASGSLRKRMEDSDESISDDEVSSRKPIKLSQYSHRISTLEASTVTTTFCDTDEILAMPTCTDAGKLNKGSDTIALYSEIAEKMKKRNSQSAFILPQGDDSMESDSPSSSDREINRSSTATVQQPKSDQRRNRNASKPNCHQINVKTQNSEKTRSVEPGSSTYNDSVISLETCISGNVPDDQAILDMKICDALDPEMNNSTIKKELMLDNSSREENIVNKLTDIMNDNQWNSSYSICNSKYPTEETLEEHENLCTKATPYECMECGLGFKCVTDLEEHCLVNKSENQYECHYCGQCFGKSDNLISHFRMHTDEKRYNCRVCDKKFTTSTEMRHHERNRKMGNCFRYCYKPQYRKAQIKTCHLMGVREAIAKEMTSQDIVKDWKNQEDIVTERNSQEDIAKEMSQSDFATNWKNREDKELTSGKPQTSDNINCDSRQVLVFPTTPMMKHGSHLMKLDTSVARHALYESKQKLTAVRPKNLSPKVTLKKKRPYGCKICKRRFMNSDSHRYHMKVHMDQLHWCDICEKCYNLASDLEQHKLALHPIASEQESSSIPLVTYSCDVCQLQYKSFESLHEHMKTHDHQCPKCSRAFSNDRLYQIHCGICTGAEVGSLAEEPNASVTFEGFEITCSPPGSDIEDEEQNMEH